MALVVTPRDVVDTAREWIGTPVMHQGWRQDTGCDCLGLLRGIGTQRGIFPADFWSLPGAARWKSYGREPIGDLLEGLDTVFDRAEGPEIGGIAAMRFTGNPRHVGVIADYPHGGFALIHALYTSVIEHRFDRRWQSRTVAYYRFRGVSYER